ncbi:MAG: hypothetical protein JRH10_11470 [Deltaproteobacteria bacterium]|nr:hypothetical protein [Deltaproteobacteria bacterium]MBW2445259.1 hypothetical protein [Deltaproteobacteria bacterium]
MGLACAGFFFVACAGAGADSVPTPEAVEPAQRWLREAEPPAGAIVVRLAFDAGADLDLYVTGPLEETVYFGNTPSKIGGRLEADVRCDAPAPRIETVVFPTARPGRYRVGVDHPESCGRRRSAAPFAVELRSTAGERRETGAARPGEFEAIVFEWIEPGPAD